MLIKTVKNSLCSVEVKGSSPSWCSIQGRIPPGTLDALASREGYVPRYVALDPHAGYWSVLGSHQPKFNWCSYPEGDDFIHQDIYPPGASIYQLGVLIY